MQYFVGLKPNRHDATLVKPLLHETKVKCSLFHATLLRGLSYPYIWELRATHGLMQQELHSVLYVGLKDVYVEDVFIIEILTERGFFSQFTGR